ncbi:UNVERIFIED_CONTAM: putative mitochondrial protein [Sesamum indicum]
MCSGGSGKKVVAGNADEEESPSFLRVFRESKKRAIVNFWWSSPADRKLHWVAWKRMCRSKRDGGLGFRELERFNIAMLAKQGWRFVTNPSSLLSRVIKTKYFPRSDFFDAKVDHNPSFTWRSIRAARDVLDGVLEMVGGLVFGGMHGFLDIITTVFNEDDAKIILSLPPPHGECDDQFISVKSAYLIPLTDLEERVGGVSSGNLAHQVWSVIWKCEVPSKVKVFLWRPSHDALPTTNNLRRRRIPVDVCCPPEDEDSYHAMLTCDLARQVWAMSGTPWRVVSQWKESAVESSSPPVRLLLGLFGPIGTKYLMGGRM